jgi:acetyltransferase-like isoleucine patch superfamily enzyme
MAGLLRRARRVPVLVGYYKGPLLMSALRKWWVRFRNPDVDVRFGRNTYLGPGFSLHAPFGGTFVTGERCEFRRGFRAELEGPDSRISFGDRSICTYDVIFQCGTTIDVGDRVIVGQATLVVDGNHRFRELDRPVVEQGYDFRPLVLENDVMVTTKCTIIASIGTRSFIGANTVVVRDVPPYCVAAGNPARVRDYFGPPGGEPAELSEANSDRSG